MNRILIVILLFMSVAAFAYPVSAQQTGQRAPEAYQAGAPVALQVLDVVLVRPFCVAGSIVSTAAFLAISPLVYVMGLSEPAARVMVEAPWRFTSFRYVGQFDHYTDEKPIMGVWELRPQY